MARTGSDAHKGSLLVEKRRHARAAIDLPVSFTVKTTNESGQGNGKDISIGGMFVETEKPAPFGAEVVIHVRLHTVARGDQDFALPAVVRWVRGAGMGVQFGLLGALETHAITELTKASE
jgi:type IV pilus assembly protein PilZ